jgi:hypothetical protein
MKFKFFTSSTTCKFTFSQKRRLHESIMHGLKDGYLSITGAESVVFLTVEQCTTAQLSRQWVTDNVFNEYQIFISPEPRSGRKKMFNTFVLERKSGQVIVIGRELPRKLALAIATGKIQRTR